MPIFDDTHMHTTAPSAADAGYGFSGTRIDQLGACEYTLVCIAADVSGSVASFRSRIEDCIAAIATACRRSPRAHNLLLRLVAFDDKLEELHGFKPLRECTPAAYAGCLPAGGTTALYDAACNAAASVSGYGKRLTDRGIGVNGILFVLTDGEDNASRTRVDDVARQLSAGVQDEHIEGLLSVLVGVNVRQHRLGQALMDFSAKAGFDEYVQLADADADTLAGLADFASRSIAIQSTLLSGASVPLRL